MAFYSYLFSLFPFYILFYVLRLSFSFIVYYSSFSPLFLLQSRSVSLFTISLPYSSPYGPASSASVFCLFSLDSSFPHLLIFLSYAYQSCPLILPSANLASLIFLLLFLSSSITFQPSSSLVWFLSSTRCCFQYSVFVLLHELSNFSTFIQVYFSMFLLLILSDSIYFLHSVTCSMFLCLFAFINV